MRVDLLPSSISIVARSVATCVLKGMALGPLPHDVKLDAFAARIAVAVALKSSDDDQVIFDAVQVSAHAIRKVLEHGLAVSDIQFDSTGGYIEVEDSHYLKIRA